ncbi:ABC transporter permease [Candidatus Bathyarchaeota archaeon]|nr:ABC transporter permease [Candidatus Bathyarchaeota archaeon]
MAIMISIPAGILASQESYNSIISNMQEETNRTATLIEVSTSSGRGGFSGMPSGTSSGTPPFGFEREEVFINETIVGEIRTIEGIKDIVEFFETSSEETTSETISTPRGDFTMSRPVYTIMGVSLNSSLIDSYSVLPTDIIVGRNLQEGDTGVVLITSNITDYYEVGLGDEIEIYGESFTIVGIYEPESESSTASREVYMSISDAQIITGNTGNVSRLDVYAENDSYVEEIADVIETYSEAYDLGLYVTTYNDRMETYQTMLNNAESTLSQTQTVAFQEIVIAIGATSLIVLFTMLYTVRERTKEIGVLKAIGFSKGNVMSQFMLEGIMISLIAGVVGVVIGIVGAPLISSLLLPSVNQLSPQQGGFSGQAINFGTALSQSVTVSPDLQTVLLAFGAVVLLGAIGSLYPAWRASRTSPMEALRYE